MSVGILLVTHGRLGHFLLDTVTEMMGQLPLAAQVLEVPRVASHDALLEQGLTLLQRLDSGDGALILTDAFGSTPSNVANKLAAQTHAAVVAGINLPMLVRIFNYPSLALDAMATSAIEGGCRGILICPRSPAPVN